ncbi:MAG: hypothetical protein AAFV45_04360 [Pseudomonadota bacterium]
MFKRAERYVNVHDRTVTRAHAQGYVIDARQSNIAAGISSMRNPVDAFKPDDLIVSIKVVLRSKMHRAGHLA